MILQIGAYCESPASAVEIESAPDRILTGPAQPDEALSPQKKTRRFQRVL
jgi:hypothetical protein